MPGVYKEKECPECKVLHRKRGRFCSQACSNSHREISDATRLKHSITTSNWKQTDDGIQSTKLFAKNVEKHKRDEEKRAKGEYVLQEDDWYVVPPGGDDDDGLIL